MYFIDSHCHLHDGRIYKDIPDIMARAEAAGVKYLVTCATKENNFKRTAELAMEYGSVLPCFGIHPWFVETLSENWQQALVNFLTTHGSGIGETGLDFMDKKANKDLQIQVFSFHLSLAMELERPINIHIRKAWDVFIHLLKKNGPLKKPGLIHSYSGSADMIPLLEKYNLYISFSGSVTRPNARKVIKSLKAVSRNRLLFETDSPDINPFLQEPKMNTMNKFNEPENLPAIAAIAAKRSQMGFEEFANQAYHNSLSVFNPILP
jgi:TatD DNase family protein